MAEFNKITGIEDADDLFDDVDDLFEDEEETEEFDEDFDENSFNIDDDDLFGEDLEDSEGLEDLEDSGGLEDSESLEDEEGFFDIEAESSGENEFDGFGELDISGDTMGLEDETKTTRKRLEDLTEEEIDALSPEELTEIMKENGIDTDDAGDIDESDEPDEFDTVHPDGQGGFEVESVDTALKRMDSIDADHDGSILQSDTLMIDNFDTVDKDADFISDTGQIVVMDESENGENFKFQYIDIEKIAIVKRIRKNTTNVEDLVQSIKSTGLLEPLVVAPTATEGVYVLLAGFRRIMACAKAGKRKIPCIVNIKANIPEIPVLEALYNHSKSYTIREIVDYIDYLEKQKGIMSASMIEYLLQLNSGDYTKLKDILNDNDDDIVSKLFDGIYTIEMAFKKLEQRRKKESAEEKDNRKAARVYEDEDESGASNIAGSGEDTEEGESLSEDEIKSLAFSANELDSVDEEDFQELVEEGNNVEGFKPHKQDYKERERLDPALRKSVLARDNNTCQICKIAEGQEFIEVLDVHHIIEVYLGGDDGIENLITACTLCHKLIHLYGRGELHPRPMEEFSEQEQARFKRIIKLGTVIRKGLAAKGMKKEQLKKLDGAETIGRTKPGTGQQAT